MPSGPVNEEFTTPPSPATLGRHARLGMSYLALCGSEALTPVSCSITTHGPTSSRAVRAARTSGTPGKGWLPRPASLALILSGHVRYKGILWGYLCTSV